MNKNALKPLQHPSPTGFWKFRGEPLTEQDISNLKAKGVRFPDKPYQSEDDYDPTLDLMPDNRLKHTRFRFRFAQRKQENKLTLREKQERRWEEYQALPEPRPDYFVWAFERDRRNIYDQLEEIALTAGEKNQRTRAINTILEFAKSKPKTQLEVSEGESDLSDMKQEELLHFYMENVWGINWDKFCDWWKQEKEINETFQ